MYKVEKNIPVPDESRGKGRPPKYPFKDMEVGDSFYIRDNATSQSSLSGSSKRYGEKNNKGFVTRKVQEGFRVWRIK